MLERSADTNKPDRPESSFGPSLKPPSLVDRRRFSTTGRLIACGTMVPIGLVAIAGGLDILTHLEQAKVEIAQNPALLAHTFMLTESLAAAGIAMVVAGSIPIIAAAADTVTGLRRFYRN